MNPHPRSQAWVAKYQSAIKIGDNFSNPFIRFKPLLLGYSFLRLLQQPQHPVTNFFDIFWLKKHCITFNLEIPNHSKNLKC